MFISSLLPGENWETDIIWGEISTAVGVELTMALPDIITLVIAEL